MINAEPAHLCYRFHGITNQSTPSTRSLHWEGWDSIERGPRWQLR
jgi:hypothetical protein